MREEGHGQANGYHSDFTDMNKGVLIQYGSVHLSEYHRSGEGHPFERAIGGYAKNSAEYQRLRRILIWSNRQQDDLLGPECS